VAGSEDLRAPLRQAHQDYLNGNGGMIIARGPLLTDGGETMTRSALLFDVADRAAAEALPAYEPHTRGRQSRCARR
jgi:hypothetical protein